MTTRVPTLCRACKRWNRQFGVCAAFPEGIPAEILLFGGDHRQPVEGDNGVVFAPGSTDEQALALQQWQRVRSGQ